MNKIINNLILTGYKFMTEFHLKQPGFIYSACGSFTKHPERPKRFRKTGKSYKNDLQANQKHLYRNKLGKASFARDAAYSDSKDLSVRTIPDKIFKDRASQIARNFKYDGYQRELASKIYKFFDKKTGLKMSANEQLAEELHIH